MVITTIRQLYHRDLSRLRTEILAYTEEESLWKVPPGVHNSGGNLCLHLVGNLKTYVGNDLAGIAYTRNRDFEFAGKGVARADLVRQVDEIIAIVDQALASLTDNDLGRDYPSPKWLPPKTIAFGLLHLHAHLNYHLGQINYHRRIAEG